MWVDNDGDGIVDEPDEPERGRSDNKLTARITNLGNAPASGYTVAFSFRPYATNASAPFTGIDSVPETGTLGAGIAREYTVDWDLRFERAPGPARIPLGPGAWQEVTAVLVPRTDEPPIAVGEPVLFDIHQRLDGEVVGGVTVAVHAPVARWGYRAGVLTGVNGPLGSMADDFDPGPMSAIQGERALGANLRLGLQAGFHGFDAEPTVGNDNLCVTNLSIFARFLAASSSLRPFALLGPGMYQADSSWDPGAQAALGLEVPVSPSLSLAAGTAAHFVWRGDDDSDLQWIDGYLGFIFAIP